MIRTSSTGHATVIELARGKGNSLDTEFLRQIRETFAGLREGPPRGVILSAEGKIFCAGLDLVKLAEADRVQLGELMVELAATLREIFSFPRPVVAAMGGHAMAGGALLSLACDLRVMAMGEARWGLTEASLGLVVPASMIEMARYSLSRPVLEKLVYGGQAYPAFKAREMGVIDDLVETDELLSRSDELIEAWTPVPQAFGEIKARLKAPAMAAMQASAELDKQFVQAWFSPAVQERVQAAVASLGKRGE